MQRGDTVFAGDLVTDGPIYGHAVELDVPHPASLSKTCPGSLISLFGYSEGAWIIDLWALQYPAEAANIYSAGLIGDPCYTDAIGDARLARMYTASCGSAADYIVGETNIQPGNSDCLSLDPVCGAGYLASIVQGS